VVYVHAYEAYKRIIEVFNNEYRGVLNFLRLLNFWIFRSLWRINFQNGCRRQFPKRESSPFALGIQQLVISLVHCGILNPHEATFYITQPEVSLTWSYFYTGNQTCCASTYVSAIINQCPRFMKPWKLPCLKQNLKMLRPIKIFIVSLGKWYFRVVASNNTLAFIQQHFDELSVNKISPIHAITYTIRRILSAESFLSRIPEVLDYLWHAEKFRQRAVEISGQIMTRQKFYKSDTTSRGQFRLLSAREEKMIAGFEDKKNVSGGREAFCECTIRCCRLVSRLWVSWLYTSSVFNSTYITSALLRNRVSYLYGSQLSFPAFVEMVKRSQWINFTGISPKKSGRCWMKRGDNLSFFWRKNQYGNKVVKLTGKRTGGQICNISFYLYF